MGRAYAGDSSLVKGVNTVFSNQSGISGLSETLEDEQNEEFFSVHVIVDSFRRISRLKELFSNRKERTFAEVKKFDWQTKQPLLFVLPLPLSSSFILLPISRRVPRHERGPAQGLILLKAFPSDSACPPVPPARKRRRVNKVESTTSSICPQTSESDVEAITPQLWKCWSAIRGKVQLFSNCRLKAHSELMNFVSQLRSPEQTVHLHATICDVRLLLLLLLNERTPMATCFKSGGVRALEVLYRRDIWGRPTRLPDNSVKRTLGNRWRHFHRQILKWDFIYWGRV